MRLIDRRPKAKRPSSPLWKSCSPRRSGARRPERLPRGLAAGPAIRLEIDRQQAEALGVSFPSINATISAALGSMYVNDFPNQGRLQQVILQALPEARMKVDDVLALPVRSRDGSMVPLSAVATPHWEKKPLQLVRYNGYPAVRIAGSAAPGRSSGDAMEEMECIADAPSRVRRRADRSLIRSGSPARGSSLPAFHAGDLPCPRRALRELVDPRSHARRSARRDGALLAALRHAERRPSRSASSLIGLRQNAILIVEFENSSRSEA